MTKVKTVNFIDGLHKWSGAENQSRNHKYLSSQHRHRFVVACLFDVTHGDRQIEIFDMQDRIEEFLNEKYKCGSTGVLDFGNMSCEMIAEVVAVKFGAYMCEVTEDGLGGGIYVRD